MSAPLADRSSFLSKRASLPAKGGVPYKKAMRKAKNDLWSPSNPDGYIALATAENKLSSDLVQQGLLLHSNFPPHLLHYQDMRGMLQLRQSIAGMLGATGCIKGVDPDNLLVLSGAGSVLDLLFHAIADAGDAVLVPAPSYPSFDSDLRVRNQVLTWPVHLAQPEELPQAAAADTAAATGRGAMLVDDHAPQQHDYVSAALDAAAAAAAEAGQPVKALLLTQPSNPQGTLCSRQFLSTCISWCLRNRVHCVSDEVYANSVFDRSAGTFVSAATVAAEKWPAGTPEAQLAESLLHVVGGLSKDLCASGIRVGWLHTKSSALASTVKRLAYFAAIPGPMQWMLAELLADTHWLAAFSAENHRRLQHSYNILTGAFDEVGIPYTPACAGVFLWADLAAALPSTFSSIDNGWAAERALWELLVSQHKVVLTPGSSCHASRPGYFRLCYAWPPAEALPVAVNRITKAMRVLQTR